MQISNAATGAVLSTQTVSSFQSGTYLDYTISGNILITFTREAGTNAVLSGLFLDSAPTPTPTSTATFLKQDATTQGTWIHTYGAQGYDVIGSSSSVSLPSYATVTPAGASSYIWASSTTDPRALQVAGGASRIAATWYSATSFTVDVDLTDGQQHDLELYFLDWDKQGRSEQVQITSAATGAVLVHPDGLVVPVGDLPRLHDQRQRPDHLHERGRAECRAQRPVPRLRPTPTPTSTATFLKQDTTTQGTWIHTYGAQGYDVIGSSSSVSLPSYATITPAGEFDLHLGLQHHRSPRTPGRRRLQPHRRRLVCQHQLHRGRRPHRWPAARPGALLPRLG